MNVALINVSGRLSTDGSRLVSALLKRAGHRVSCVFLSRREPLLYDSGELALLDPLLAEADLVMLAVYSSYALRAVQLSDHVRQHHPRLKVVWGGPHCISVPEHVLRHADGVCFSEGDEAVVELCDRLQRGGDWADTPNFAFRSGAEIRRNPVLPPFRDLDSLPYYDFELEGQFLLDRVLEPMCMDHLRRRLASFPMRVPTFYFMSSRGCPHNCAYCNNCRYQAMWGKVPIRLHSVERVITELEFQLARLSFVEFVAFGDDDFFVRPRDQIEEFARQYRSRIGLPFGVAVSARTFRKDKMEILRDAGLIASQMGVQSGSQRVLDEVFHRTISIARTKQVVDEAAPLFKGKGTSFSLDFIIDNPWETRQDVYRTCRYILDLPAGVLVNVFFLAYFPGTPVYDRAVAEGIIRASSQRAGKPYTRSRLRFQRNWETVLVLAMHLLRLAVRRRSTSLQLLLRFLTSRPVRLVMSLPPAAFFSALARTLQLVQFTALRRREKKALR